MTWATVLAGLGRLMAGLLSLLPYLGAYIAGKRSQRASETEETLDDIRTAELARDRLRHDPEYRDRVRDRFTR